MSAQTQIIKRKKIILLNIENIKIFCKRTYQTQISKRKENAHTNTNTIHTR